MVPDRSLLFIHAFVIFSFMSTEAPVGVGIIGASGDHYVASHRKELARTPFCEIKAVADINPAGLIYDAYRDAYKTSKEEGWREVIARDDVHLVFGMMPDDSHTTLLEAIVTAGKHPFVEKPLATTSGELAKLKDSLVRARESGILVFSCHPRGEDPPVQRIKEYIGDRNMIREHFGFAPEGPVTEYHSYCAYPAPDPTKEGHHLSFMIDKLSHGVNELTQLFGMSGLTEVEVVKDGPVEYMVQGQREDGILFSVGGHRKFPRGQGYGYGEYATVGFADGQELKVNMLTGKMVLRQSGGKEYPREDPEYKTNYDLRHQRTNDRVIDAVRGVTAPSATPEQLFMNTLVPIRLFESGSNRKIDIPLPRLA